jgi:hypothetical protein
MSASSEYHVSIVFGISGDKTQTRRPATFTVRFVVLLSLTK